MSLQSQRTSGILLHPTSLPGPHGCGDLGREARNFVDFLVAGKQRLWQTLPIHPPELKTQSPYASLSSFAVSPWLTSLEILQQRGLLGAADLDLPAIPEDRLRAEAMIARRWPALQRAAKCFFADADAAERGAYERFIAAHAAWLDDYALFMALAQVHGDEPWNTWPAPLAHRDPAALAEARGELGELVEVHRFVQFEVERQWRELKAYANARGVSILGDIPIYVAHQSADVWALPQLFALEPETGEVRLEAGVPGDDFFDPDGQLWGMPVYDWERMAEDGHRFWVDRLRRCFTLFDQLRIDHFRGFAGYWAIPRGHPASAGRWLPGPGQAFFEAMRSALGELPIFVEDLGLITEDVHAMRRACGFAGMVVAQFGFDGDPQNIHRPHLCERNMVMYTGTHDVPTAREWYEHTDEFRRADFLSYLGSPSTDVHWDMIRLAWSSPAERALCPLQDVLGQAGEGRMNRPGTTSPDNWSWRFRAEALRPELAERLAGITRTYGR